MRHCPPERLADTSSISDCKRFVAGFQSVSNISASGQRRHLLGVRISYLLTATYVVPETPVPGPNLTISLIDLLSMIRVSHKAFGCQWCADESAVDLYYLNQA